MAKHDPVVGTVSQCHLIPRWHTVFSLVAEASEGGWLTVCCAEGAQGGWSECPESVLVCISRFVEKRPAASYWLFSTM